MVCLPMEEQSDERTPVAGADMAWAIMGVLLSGLLVWGAIGWLGDRLLGTSFLLPVGLLIGAAGGIYLVAKRFGQM